MGKPLSGRGGLAVCQGREVGRGFVCLEAFIIALLYFLLLLDGVGFSLIMVRRWSVLAEVILQALYESPKRTLLLSTIYSSSNESLQNERYASCIMAPPAVNDVERALFGKLRHIVLACCFSYDEMNYSREASWELRSTFGNGGATAAMKQTAVHDGTRHGPHRLVREHSTPMKATARTSIYHCQESNTQ